MNPVNSSVFDGSSASTVPTNPINEPNVQVKQGLNTFDLTGLNSLTARFGDITPYFYTVAVPNDRTTLRPTHNLRTYTFGSPLMSAVRMHVQNFSVPLSSLMPNTWEYIYKNPVKGTDIPDNALCSFNFFNFQTRLLSFIVGAYEFAKSQVGSNTQFRYKWFLLPYLMLYYNTFSLGGLLHYLGINCNYESSHVNQIDKRFDDAFSALCQNLQSRSSDVALFSISLNDANRNYFTVYPTRKSLRSLFYFVAQNPIYFVSYGYGYIDTIISDSELMAIFGDFIDSLIPSRDVFESYFDSDLTVDNVQPMNLYKVIAYQQICCQYFSNDHIDNIYSSKLYMSNMKSIAYKVFGTSSGSLFFNMNGVPVFYDVFSDKILSFLVSSFIVSDFTVAKLDSSRNALYFFLNLFTFQNSLKYGDYFNGSRAQPLAVGSVSIPVTGSSYVSAIDTTKGITYQRFLNAVNRAGSYIKEYVKSIFGVTPEQTEPMPNFLSRETFVIGKDEIDNTSGTETQGNVVTNLIDNDGRFAFDIFVDTPSVILGLISFDAIGSYKYVTERDNFHLDRYDMFNPMLQNIGDQPVTSNELYPARKASDNFGYQVRNAEYKFKVNQCHGGFCYNLPSWLFTFDDVNRHFIDSYYIRHHSEDFDDFYKSLTYASEAGYYHFIVTMSNEVKSNRRMQYEPPIL